MPHTSDTIRKLLKDNDRYEASEHWQTAYMRLRPLLEFTASIIDERDAEIARLQERNVELEMLFEPLVKIALDISMADGRKPLDSEVTVT